MICKHVYPVYICKRDYLFINVFYKHKHKHVYVGRLFLVVISLVNNGQVVERYQFLTRFVCLGSAYVGTMMSTCYDGIVLGNWQVLVEWVWR